MRIAFFFFVAFLALAFSFPAQAQCYCEGGVFPAGVIIGNGYAPDFDDESLAYEEDQQDLPSVYMYRRPLVVRRPVYRRYGYARPYRPLGYPRFHYRYGEGRY